MSAATAPTRASTPSGTGPPSPAESRRSPETGGRKYSGKPPASQGRRGLFCGWQQSSGGLRSTQETAQGGLERFIEAEDLPHAEGRDDGSLPDAVELAEIGQRDDQGDEGHGDVKAHFHGVEGQVELLGDDLHDALSRQGDQPGLQIEQDTKGNQHHADEQIDQPHPIDDRGREGQRIGVRQKHPRQKVGEIGKVTEQGGADQLQDPGWLEIPPQDNELDQDVQGKDNDDPGTHGQGCKDLTEHVGDRVYRGHPQVGFAGKRHTQRHDEQPRAVYKYPF